jgi:hypothetical protein
VASLSGVIPPKLVPGTTIGLRILISYPVPGVSTPRIVYSPVTLSDCIVNAAPTPPGVTDPVRA